MIEVKGVRKSFGRTEVLKGIDLAVATGEVVAIIGPSGSGKTTFLRCLNFLERADGGHLTVGDVSVDLRKAGARQIREVRLRTAMVFQDYSLFSNKTALENVTEGLIVARGRPRDEAERIGLAYLEKVGLLGKKDAYPAHLSGGQQQRVGIARALALSPEVILFDEPTSSLDPERVEEVLDCIRNAAREGIAMVVVTHELPFAFDIADRIVFMDGGVVVEESDPRTMRIAPREERTRRFLGRVLPAADYEI
ncbi:MAG: amino acid ABC transporter ATP-binding protein [Telmatospirillum sp.]|nr:amino acid ABC transporter ATP-binding protein [Telmatospirillum sp.]